MICRAGCRCALRAYYSVVSTAAAVAAPHWPATCHLTTVRRLTEGSTKLNSLSEGGLLAKCCTARHSQQLSAAIGC